MMSEIREMHGAYTLSPFAYKLYANSLHIVLSFNSSKNKYVTVAFSVHLQTIFLVNWMNYIHLFPAYFVYTYVNYFSLIRCEL